MLYLGDLSNDEYEDARLGYIFAHSRRCSSVVGSQVTLDLRDTSNIRGMFFVETIQFHPSEKRK